jgi:hypothetical protein
LGNDTGNREQSSELAGLAGGIAVQFLLPADGIFDGEDRIGVAMKRDHLVVWRFPPGEVCERAGEAVDLVDDYKVDPASLDIG